MRDLEHPYAAAVALVLVAFVVRLGIEPWASGQSPLLLFTAAIVIAAGRYGTGPGLVSIFLSLALGTVAFVAPDDFFDISADQLTSLGVFLVTSAAMLVFAAHLKASNEQAIRLQAELQQAHTESAMGTMAATLAHELNQPLAAAGNYLAACKRFSEKVEGDARPRLDAGLSEAESQIHRAGEIIRHARDMVLSKAAEREPVSLCELVSRVMSPLRASGTCEEASLSLDVDPAADELLVNTIQIEQVVMNLVRNACQAANGNGGADIRICGNVADQFCLVEVRDRGPGIAEERLPSLFTAERQPSNGGLGLGLSISRAIVEAHGGRIWAQNNREGGASFFFTVPRAIEPI